MVPKRGHKSSVGVADYFAVLGINDSFDQVQQANGNHDAEKRKTSAPEPEELATPRNSNVSIISNGTTQVSLDVEVTNNRQDIDNAENDSQNIVGPRQMHEERFYREIVHLALVSSMDEFDPKNWVFVTDTCSDSKSCNHDHAGISMLGKVPINIRGVDYSYVRLAYQTRRSYQQVHSNDNDYLPAVAEIQLHYAKVRASTIPHCCSWDEEGRRSHQMHKNYKTQIYTGTTKGSIDDKSSNKPLLRERQATVQAVAYGAAKHLSSLAQRTGLAVTAVTRGKEILNDFGLRNAVTLSSRVAVVGNDGSNNNNGSGINSTQIDTVQSSKNLEYHLYDMKKEGPSEPVYDGSTTIFNNANKELSSHRIGSSHVEKFDNDREHLSLRVANCSDVSSFTSSNGKRQYFFPDALISNSSNIKDVGNDSTNVETLSNDGIVRKSLSEMLPLPDNYQEWIVPDFCNRLHLPTTARLQRYQQEKLKSMQQYPSRRFPILIDRTHSNVHTLERAGGISPPSMGVEAMYRSPLSTPSMHPINAELTEMDSTLRASADVPLVPCGSQTDSSTALNGSQQNNPAVPDSSVIPTVVSWRAVQPENDGAIVDIDDYYVFIPVLAIRRQRIGEDERFHEDPAIIDIQLAYLDSNGIPPCIVSDSSNDDENEIGLSAIVHPDILKKSQWIPSCSDFENNLPSALLHGRPAFFIRRNIPDGFADIAFPARVLDRFPQKNHRSMPFPEEELPLFCYPKGSFLVRDKLNNLPIPKCYGFVVKNERGNSIYVSCLSFLEPLNAQRKKQLRTLSLQRRTTSLPHRLYCEKNHHSQSENIFDKCSIVGFDDIVTFESKTICLVGRYPYWTAFRLFLIHLHLLSGLSSDIPLERLISHLLLAVPLPKPGGQCVLIPTTTMNEPMALVMPPQKDLPLVDLTYRTLFSALDVPTVVTILLGFLCLEKKVILISTRQSLLLDCCELLKSLLFPFELCAPYVPYLTAPFMSCLEFPGAIFVGIHDDEATDGLACMVRRSIPEDSIIVELDSGEIHCDRNRYETLKAAYQIIPADSRSILIKEIDTLCKQSRIVPGQEPLDYSVDSIIDSSLPSGLFDNFGKNVYNVTEPLDDRAIRDCFLRFFCSILGGYERYLVVPDANFLISGNDWFDSAAFLASATPLRSSFLSILVGTQLFQSFIQRRTEASDVHCMLFDECLVEYHSSTVPYGLLGNGRLLVDQCATEPDCLLEERKFHANDVDSVTQASSCYADSAISESVSFDTEIPFAINESGDIVTIPSLVGLPSNACFSYCIDGQPSFPTRFNRDYFFPKEPEFLFADSSEFPPPILIRSEREKEEANRLLSSAVSTNGPQKKHRCLWQLPKFMGSQFLGAWLMCVPNQLSQSNSSIREKSKILLRALGALRTLRSHQRIVADEAAYRALIVACGKCGFDRRIELMKLYSLMRTDGIFPNAVTMGQYTRAMAEGFSKRLDDGQSKVGMHVIVSADGLNKHETFNLEILDVNLQNLEDSGQRWRSQGNSAQDPALISTGIESRTVSIDERDEKQSIYPTRTFDTINTQKTSKHRRSWLPVCCSSSFRTTSNIGDCTSIRLFALWSRTVACESCQYVPLDEEIQCGWDAIQYSSEKSTSIACPRCDHLLHPQLGYKELEILDALGSTHNGINGIPSLDEDEQSTTRDTAIQDLPAQLEFNIRDVQAHAPCDERSRSGFVAYLSPYKLRLMLEELLEEFGEEVLHRNRLRDIDSQVFFNLWWYCARFSLPLPLAIAPFEIDACDRANNVEAKAIIYDYCAFASWDKSVALYGCHSAARAISAAQSLHVSSERALREKIFDNPNTEMPLLAFFNLQSYAQGDWEHADLSDIIVTLVKACETRDLIPVIDCIYQRNAIRNQERESKLASMTHRGTSQSVECNSLNTSFQSAASLSFSVGESNEVYFSPSVELDCYRTVLYLVRYQCMTAFHAFFPTTTKACKGYHFWCAQGTPLSIFDRAFREAAQEYRKIKKIMVPIQDASEVALGFRCVFGHII